MAQTLQQRMREADRLRQQREAEAAERAAEMEKRRARHEGYQMGAEARRKLEQLYTHPIAQELIAQAGRELGRAVARKAEEAGTPGHIAYRVAEEVWSYMQKTGAPLEETIRASVNHHMDVMETRLTIHVDAMTLTSAVDDHLLDQMGARRWA